MGHHVGRDTLQDRNCSPFKETEGQIGLGRGHGLAQTLGNVVETNGENGQPCRKSLVLFPFKALCTHFMNMKNAFKT